MDTGLSAAPDRPPAGIQGAGRSGELGAGLGATPAAPPRADGPVARWLGRGWLVAASALLTWVLVDVLRIWLPSIVNVYGDAGSTPAAELGAFAVLWFLLPLPVALVTRRVSPRMLWLAAMMALAVLRVALQLTDGGQPQLYVACGALLAGAIALVALAAGTPSGHLARVGVVLGLSVSTVAHAALGTLDLQWRPGAAPLVAVGVLSLATLVTAELARRVPLWWPTEIDGEVASVWTRGAAWPWLSVGPAIALTGILVAAPARLAIAAGWTPRTIVVALAIAAGLAVVAAALSPVVGAPVTSALAAACLLVGVFGALRPLGSQAAVAQLILLVGIGAVLGASGTTPADSGPRRRGTAAGCSLLLFFVVGFLYYGGYEIALPLRGRTLLVVTAVGLVVAAGAAAWTGRLLRPTRRLPVRTLAATVVATLLVSLASTAIVPAAGPPWTAPIDGSLRVALYNIHNGYDVEGRFVPREIAEVLRSEDVDLVVLNEVDRGWLLQGGHDLLSLLAADLGMSHVVFAPAADDVWGNAILSRAPLRDTRVERLPQVGSVMRRSFVSAVVELGNGHALAIVGTHLHHVEGDGSVRLAQARSLAAEVSRLRTRDLPVALLGDLNAARDSADLEPLRFLDDAVPGDAPTYPSHAPERRIDHVLISPDLAPSQASIPSTTVSDHLPVIVTLRPVGNGVGTGG